MIIHKIEPKQIKKRKRAAAYIRVSSVLHTQEESFETQYEVYRSMIEADPDLMFTAVYSDKGKSGTSIRQRAGFQQMIKDALDHKFDIVFTKSISRFARNVADCLRTVELFREHDIIVVFEKENIRTDDIKSYFALALIGAISQDESNSISRNISMAIHERFSRGQYNLGNNRILGYDSIGGKLVPNKDAWIVSSIFTQFVQGETYTAIANTLNSMGILTIRKNPFTLQAVRCIINNETYAGDKLLQKNPPRDYITHKPDPNVSFNQYYITDDHEPIISKQIWEQAQMILKQKKEVYPAHHPLYGKVICAECGTPYKRRTATSRSGKYYKVWVCKERLTGKYGCGCKNRNIKEEQLLTELSPSLPLIGEDENCILIHRQSIEVTMRRPETKH